MSHQNNLYEERKQLFEDVYTGIIPKRVPIKIGLATEVYIQHEGLPLGETQWTYDHLETAIENVVKNLKVDAFPSDVPRSPVFSQVSGNQFWLMGKSGFMQHPEATFMETEEYDCFIKNPYDFVLEKLMPRICTAMDDNAVRRSLVFLMSATALQSSRMNYGMMTGRLSGKYQFYDVPMEQNAFCLNPFDYIADSLRGFKGIAFDIKRNPQKVIEATEALLPALIKFALPRKVSNVGSTFMPCHMPTFLRTKEFEKFFYPGFSKLIHATAEMGQTFSIFCEDDWTRYLDYLQDLPQGTRFQFEYGDPKLIKEKLGKKHVICGLYPSSILKTGTKEACIDKAKELIDIMAPGGNFYFNFDKAPMSLVSTNLENLGAVVEYVSENTNYANAGEKVFTSDKKATVKSVLKDIPQFKSKYFKAFANVDYPVESIEKIVTAKINGCENMAFNTVMGML